MVNGDVTRLMGPLVAPGGSGIGGRKSILLMTTGTGLPVTGGPGVLVAGGLGLRVSDAGLPVSSGGAVLVGIGGAERGGVPDV